LRWWFGRVPPGKPILATGLSLILGGALGNMLDRARIGSVIDFVHMYYKAWSFAVFNFADAAITVGVIVTVASTVWRRLALVRTARVSRCVCNSLHFRFWHLSDVRSLPADVRSRQQFGLRRHEGKFPKMTQSSDR
jgi:Signal peptidase (SPase) II